MIELLYDGVDIWPDVIIESVRFTTAANGLPGTGVVKVKDPDHSRSFVQGRDLELVIDGDHHWSGYVARVRRGYFLIDDKSASSRVRFLEIEGIDLNILFSRRFLYDKTTPTTVQLTTYPAGTADDTIIKQYVDDHLDLDDDAITTTLVEHVGTPSTDSQISGQAGWAWGEFMSFIRRNIGSIFYLDPDRNLVYTDVDTPSAAIGISDSVLPDLIDGFDRATPSAPAFPDLGSGGAIIDSGELVAPAGEIYDSPVFVGAVETGSVQFDFWAQPDPSGGMFYEVDFRPFDSWGVFVDMWDGGDGDWIVELYGTTEPLQVDLTVPPEGAWYTVKAEFTIALARIKAWPRGDTEPDWQGSVSAPVSLYSIPQGWAPTIGIESSADIAARMDNLRVGSSEVGCRDLEIEYWGDKLANEAFVWGAGQGAQGVVLGHVRDDDSVAEHNLWQEAQYLTSVFRQETVDRIADTTVNGSPQSKRGAKDDAVAVRCTVFDTRFRVAQKVSVRSAVFGFVGVLPVRSVEITTPKGIPQFVLELSHEIDTPWSTSEFWIPQIPPFDPIHIPRIEIGDPRLPVFDPCAEINTGPITVVFDDFNRVGVLSGSTSTAGFVWTHTGAPSLQGTNGSAYVVTDSDHPFTVTRDGAPWGLGPFTMRIRFRMTAPSSFEDGQVLIVYLGFQEQFRVAMNSNNGYVRLRGNPATDFSKTDWLVGVWYTIEIQRGLLDWNQSRLDLSDEINGGLLTRVLVDHGVAFDAVDNRISMDIDDFADTIEIDYIEFDLPEGRTYLAGEEMGIFGGGEGCAGDADTFSRTEASGWGTSEINGNDWETYPGNESAGVSVDGSVGQFVSSIGQTIQGLELGSGYFADPLDFCMYYEAEVVVTSGSQIVVEFSNVPTDFSSEYLSSGMAFIVDGTDVLGTATLVTTLDSSGSADVLLGSLSGGTATISVKVRVVFNGSNSRMKFWLASDPEPDEWNVEGIPNGSLDWQRVFIYLTAGGGPTNSYAIDNFTLGAPDGNPCGDGLDHSDPPHGEVCESMVDEIEPPPLRPPEDSYYQVRTSFRPASTRVWMQGRLLRYVYDYTEIYTEGIIQIDDAVIASADVGPLAIYICYYAEPVYLVVV